MAKYTTELRTICESYAGYDSRQGYMKTKDVISEALPKLFDFDFPIYDEAYRTVLETKIVKHFYTREICAETIGRWKLFLDEKLNLIMPYYNEWYKSTTIEFNPLYDVDITTEHTKGNEGNSENSGSHDNSVENNRTYGRSDKYERNLTNTNHDTVNGTDWTYNNDTPQGGINGLESLNYLSSATKNTTANTTDSNGTQGGSDSRVISDTDDTSVSDTGSIKGNSKYTDTETYLQHVVGKTSGASYSKLLSEYRKTIVNIDMEIINELEDLFMQIW